jgi:hypothetical protein
MCPQTGISRVGVCKRLTQSILLYMYPHTDIYMSTYRLCVCTCVCAHVSVKTSNETLSVPPVQSFNMTLAAAASGADRVFREPAHIQAQNQLHTRTRTPDN